MGQLCSGRCVLGMPYRTRIAVQDVTAGIASILAISRASPACSTDRSGSKGLRCRRLLDTAQGYTVKCGDTLGRRLASLHMMVSQCRFLLTFHHRTAVAGCAASVPAFAANGDIGLAQAK